MPAPIVACELNYRDGLWAIHVPVCPYCAQSHTHGSGQRAFEPKPKLAPDEHRSTHCLDPYVGGGGYFLLEMTAGKRQRKKMAKERNGPDVSPPTSLYFRR